MAEKVGKDAAVAFIVMVSMISLAVAAFIYGV